MTFAISLLVKALLLFLGMVLLIEVGRRIGTQRLASDSEGSSDGTAVMDGAVFGLLGLLMAFTFSGAATRFDTRRQLVVEEVNDIGTAYLRLDLLSGPSRIALQDKFQRYVDSRIEYFQSPEDFRVRAANFRRSEKLQNEIWAEAVLACKAEPQTPATMLLLPALNQMIDITSTRLMATRMHPPGIVFGLLIGLALLSALLAGRGMAGSKSRNWIHIIGYASIFAITVYVILDIEYPRLGLIRMDAADQMLLDLRASMK